eukprot:gnl/TRDRNA2_/TRDRNA2_86576_c0_seq2.p1 gnl/TRDRNA2_/TRDRNA2_86576_c0~~gnl/TRDRNA2_/TRDRNA2_86576_c0_seq2.p1  ORF type:complete len:239 (+),score=41.80 gnl/TRDRNA2_/TRDRNA2_86576_c0_seq2:53-718(+)
MTARRLAAVESRRRLGSFVRSCGSVNFPTGIVTGVPQRLSDIAKVDLLQQEPSARVREIWIEQFHTKERIVAGVMAAEEFAKFKDGSSSCPMFICPVPRGEGYMNFVWQSQGPHGTSLVYKTLEAFQANSEGVDLNVKFFSELLDSHQLTLLHGELRSGVLTKEEASLMVRYTREAYTDPTMLSWVHRFNHSPSEFDYEQFFKDVKPLERWHARDKSNFAL